MERSWERGELGTEDGDAKPNYVGAGRSIKLSGQVLTRDCLGTRRQSSTGVVNGIERPAFVTRALVRDPDGGVLNSLAFGGVMHKAIGVLLILAPALWLAWQMLLFHP